MARKPLKGKGKAGRLKWRTIIIPFSTLQFWINFFIVLVLIAAVSLGVFYLLLSPKAQARKMISKVEKRFDQAIVLGIKELAYEDFRTIQETLFLVGREVFLLRSLRALSGLFIPDFARI